jgi:hypothetical protein
VTNSFIAARRLVLFLLRLILTLANVLTPCLGHHRVPKQDDYQESLCWLVSYTEEYANYGESAAKEHGKDSKLTLTSDPALKQVTKELRMHLEGFANEKSIDTIIDAGNWRMGGRTKSLGIGSGGSMRMFARYFFR